jgi:hypothetical protein
MEMRQKILGVLTVALVMMVGQGSIAGTGVANGGNSARDQYLEKLKREMSHQGDVTAWCNQISSILKRERQRAMLQYQFNRGAEALQILNDALVTAGQSLEVDPEKGGPMTKKLIDRTLMYSQALDQAMVDSSQLSTTTKLNFLFESINFISEIARDLDPPYYIPYRYRYRDCRDCDHDFDFGAFQRIFIRMASRQLSFVTNQLTENRSGPEGLQTFPLGDPRAFLAIAELATSYVAQDLRDNLHAYANACVIRDLESLSETLTAYNLYHDRSIFPNDRWAVGQSAEEMNRLSAQILNNSGCRY